MRIAFMGTPDFAVPSLAALIDAGYAVVAAFTQPDRPSGRGNKVTACPVKCYAVDHGIPVFQFERIRRAEGAAALSELKPDLCVTAAFGQILSKKLLEIPPLGTLNVHASLLPKYRGAAPINWCIALGERETGVTIMFTDAGVDTGDIAMMRSTPVGDAETAGELSARLSVIGAELLVEAVAAVDKGTCPRVPQDHAAATHLPMLNRDMGRIDWTMSAQEIERRIRGFDPWPGSFTYLGETQIKIWSVAVVDTLYAGVPGEIVGADPKTGLRVACGCGMIHIDELQAPGAKRMASNIYLRGRPIATGIQLK